MKKDKSRNLQHITTWGGFLLLGVAAYFFIFTLLPEWQPKLQDFWRESQENISIPLLLHAVIFLFLGYYFAPTPWRKILDALKIPRIDRGGIRRNWYVTQMGQYVPGKIWMVVGRITFMKSSGVSPTKSVTAFILENIYLMVALAVMAIIALPFLSPADIPLALIIVLWISIGLGIIMLFAPGIQKKLAHRISRRLGTDVDDLPHISHRHQAVFIGYHLLSWGLRSTALYFWFRGFGVEPDHPFAMFAICLLAAPASWFIALSMVFIPGGIGIREGIQGLLLSVFVVGGAATATVIALGMRVLVIFTESIFAIQAIIYGFLRKRFFAKVNHIEQFFHLGGSVLKGFFALHGLSPPPQPINVTFSITRKCQSKCKTCFIWKHDPGDDLDIQTIENLFRSIGWTYFFNVSGGEPFLRSDLPEIIRLACRYMKPAVIHIPTNAIAPNLVEKLTAQIMDIIDIEAPGTILSVKPSFDGIGGKHDSIRGIPGNFEKLLDTLDRLKQIRENHSNLHIGVGTVISKFNENDLIEIIAYAKDLGVDTYINEIAEEREEFFNLGSGITPEGTRYADIMEMFENSVLDKMQDMKLLGRMTTALRIVYYGLVIRILKEKRQVIPCSAGLLNVHINSSGSVWPCAILAYKAEMGTLDNDTDFMDIWRSKTAKAIRKSIRSGECYCPLANQAYSNILLHCPSLFRALRIALRGRT